MPLIDNLIKFGYLETLEIIGAFRKIKREDFVLPENKDQAEVDAPLDIGYGQTISQPATVAFMLGKLRAEAGDKILDVGCGSGWTTALLARLVGPTGKVYGLERIGRLADFAAANVGKYDFIKSGVAHVVWADGFYGLPEFSLFDKILVSAAAETVPEELLKQLKVGGRLVMPIGRRFETQSIVVIEKNALDEFNKKEYPGFIFVPLIKDN